MPDPFDALTESIRGAARGFLHNATGPIDRDEWDRLFSSLAERKALIKAVAKLPGEQASEAYAQHLFRDAKDRGIKAMRDSGRRRVYAFFDAENYQPGLWLPESFNSDIGAWFMGGEDVPIKLLSITAAADHIAQTGKEKGDQWRHRADVAERVQSLNLGADAKFGDRADDAQWRVFEQ